MRLFGWGMGRPPDRPPDLVDPQADSVSLGEIELRLRQVWGEIQAHTRYISIAAQRSDKDRAHLVPMAGVAREVWDEIQDIRTRSIDLLLGSWNLLTTHNLLMSEIYRNIESENITSGNAQDFHREMAALLKQFKTTKISGAPPQPGIHYFQGAHDVLAYGNTFNNNVNTYQVVGPDPAQYRRFLKHLVFIQTLLF